MVEERKARDPDGPLSAEERIVQPLQGTLCLYGRCNECYHLVLDGKLRGTIWHVLDAEDLAFFYRPVIVQENGSIAPQMSVQQGAVRLCDFEDFMLHHLRFAIGWHALMAHEQQQQHWCNHVSIIRRCVRAHSRPCALLMLFSHSIKNSGRTSPAMSVSPFLSRTKHAEPEHGPEVCAHKGMYCRAASAGGGGSLEKLEQRQHQSKGMSGDGRCRCGVTIRALDSFTARGSRERARENS